MELLDPFLQAVMSQAHGLFLVPNIDGYVMPECYSDLLESGKIKDIPYLLGSTKDDIFTSKKEVTLGKKSALRRGCEDFAELLLDHGRKSVYLYEFVADLPGDDAGAFHSSELWYTFGTLTRSWRPFTDEDAALSERMLDYWINFMKCGNPNCASLPEWNPWRGPEDTLKLTRNATPY